MTKDRKNPPESRSNFISVIIIIANMCIKNQEMDKPYLANEQSVYREAVGEGPVAPGRNSCRVLGSC